MCLPAAMANECRAFMVGSDESALGADQDGHDVTRTRFCDAVLAAGLGEVPADERTFRHATIPCAMPRPRSRCASPRPTPDVRLQIVEGGQHFLSASGPDTVNEATAAFIYRCSA